MNRSVKIAIVAIAALFIMGAIAIIGINSDPSNQQNSSNPLIPQPAPKDSNGATIITYTEDGFTPDTYTVQANSTLRIRNRSIRILEFSSDPFPARTDNPELNVGRLNPDDTKTFYLSQKGVWGFHNSLDASEHGYITVQ